MNPVTDTLPTSASLLSRLRDLDDQRSWNNFFEKYQQRVMNVARSCGLTHNEAEEAVQEVFKRVARTICNYNAALRPGSFRRWLFNLTKWRAADQLRERVKFMRFSRHSEWMSDSNNGEARTPIIERVPAPCENEMAFEEEARRYMVESLLKKLERTISPKHLQIFQLLVLDEASPVEVARLYGMSLTNVAVTKHRVAAKLRKELSRLQFVLE